MNIGNVSLSSPYMGQLSAMGNRFGFGGGGAMAQKGDMGRPPDPVEIFNKVDEDGSGGLDQTEFQDLADKISEATGQEVDVEALFATYDADGDGVLNQEETDSAMAANRPQGPPPGGMMGGMQGGMQGGAPPDLSQIFTDTDEDEDGSLNETEAQSLADMISKATGEEMEAEALLETYDTDEDGVLSEEEATTALEANQPEGPPPPGGMPPQVHNSGSAHVSAIESYLQMAFQGAGQDRESNMFAMFGGSAPSDGSSPIFSVDTRI
jgi:Ca2+-binding EF-hand superfamily protein